MLEELKEKVCAANLDLVKKGVLDKHYFRKHGANAYYGQTEERKKI